MAACDCMRGSRKRIMEWGFSMDTGGGVLFLVILLNFTIPSMENFSFSLELRMQRSFFFLE